MLVPAKSFLFQIVKMGFSSQSLGQRAGLQQHLEPASSQRLRLHPSLTAGAAQHFTAENDGKMAFMAADSVFKLMEG